MPPLILQPDLSREDMNTAPTMLPADFFFSSQPGLSPTQPHLTYGARARAQFPSNPRNRCQPPTRSPPSFRPDQGQFERLVGDREGGHDGGLSDGGRSSAAYRGAYNSWRMRSVKC